MEHPHDSDWPSPRGAALASLVGRGLRRLRASQRRLRAAGSLVLSADLSPRAGPRRVHHRRAGGAAAPQCVSASGSTLNYARNEFSIFNYDAIKEQDDGGARANLIANVLGADLWAALRPLQSLPDRASRCPMTLYQNGQSFNDANPPPGGTHVAAPIGFALGDPRLHLKVRHLRQGARASQLALSHWLGFPLGNDKRLRRREALHRLLRRAAPARRLGGARSGASALFVGFLWRAHVSQFFSTVVGQQLTYGGAIAVDADGAAPHAPGRSLRPLELCRLAHHRDGVRRLDHRHQRQPARDRRRRQDLGHLRPDAATSASAPASSPASARRSRASFSALVWAPNFRRPRSRRHPRQRRQVSRQPEDKDGFKDDDGCPDPDNDGDTIPDDDDKCPNQAGGLRPVPGRRRLPRSRQRQRRHRRLCTTPARTTPRITRRPKPNDGCPASKTDTDGDGIPDEHRQVPERSRGQGRLRGRGRLPRSRQRQRRHPRRLRPVPERAGGHGRLPGRGRLPRSRQRQGRHPRQASTSARTSRRPSTAIRTRTAAPTRARRRRCKIDVKSTDRHPRQGLLRHRTRRRSSRSASTCSIRWRRRIKAHAEIKIEIQGHTDAQGDMDAQHQALARSAPSRCAPTSSRRASIRRA